MLSSATVLEERRLDAPAAGVLRGLRLLIVADSSSTHTHRWAHWARGGGAEVTVLSTFPDGIEGVNVVHFPGEPRWYHRIPKVRMLADYPRFRRLIRRLAPQLIHFHFISEGGRAFYWDAIDVPMVGSSWGQDVIFDVGATAKAESSLRKMLARCRLVTATTHQLAGATARYTPPGKPIYVIPFGVELERFKGPGLRSQGSGQVTIGFVKHLLPKYGPDVAVEAFARIHAARPNTRLVLAGRGTMREQLERRVAELGLAGAVEIVGRVPHEQVPELIASFDLMIMPSVYESETFGVAAIEASASGVPVVASRVGGVPEAVLHGVSGLLVRPGDAEELAAACIALIDDPARRAEMGRAGQRFVEKYYVWKRNTALMEEVYRAALRGGVPRGVPVYRDGAAPELSAE
jgi:glycosyltransferase involved in cell wall biosynthesis